MFKLKERLKERITGEILSISQLIKRPKFEVLVNCLLVKLAQEKGWLGKLTVPT